MKNILPALILLLPFLCCMQSCSFEKMGKSLTKGVASQADTIGYNLVDGIENRITSEQSREQLQSLLDSVISAAGLNANRQVQALRDSILNDGTQAWVKQLMDNVAGDSTKMRLAALRNELLGEATASRLKALVEGVMNGILNDSAAIRMAQLRDTLLGTQTSLLIRDIVDTAMAVAAQRLKNDINPAIKEDASFVKKYAMQLLITLGILAAGIIILIWRNKQRYLKMTTLLTAQIDSMPDQRSYDELTDRIRSSALQAGVEAPLREILSKNGMLGKENWQVMRQKRADGLGSKS